MPKVPTRPAAWADGDNLSSPASRPPQGLVDPPGQPGPAAALDPGTGSACPRGIPGWLGRHRHLLPGMGRFLGSGLVTGGLAVFLFLLSSCDLQSPNQVQQPQFSIMTWNLQNLFDPEYQGREYEDFNAEDWTWDLYRRRIILLAQAVASLSDLAILEDGQVQGGLPDILCLQEVENQRVMDDLLTELQQGCGSQSPWHWAAISPDSGTALGLGVLAPWAPTTQRVHRLWVNGEESRYVWELEFDLGPDSHFPAGGRLTGGFTLHVFVNHWKSRLGGDSTEALRRVAARLVRRRSQELLEAGGPRAVICLGDLNAQGKPGESGGEFPALLCQDLPIALSTGERTTVLSLVAPDDLITSPQAVDISPEAASRIWQEPWLASWPRAEAGSYFIEDAWERIDHILMTRLPGSGGLEYLDFSTPEMAGARTAGGLPARWLSSTGRGCSDHLALFARFRISTTGSDGG